MTWAQLSEVWTPISIGFAIVAGVGFGYFLVGWVASTMTWASGLATPGGVSWLAVSLVSTVGLLFYGGQVWTSYLVGDTAWTRVVSRFVLWLLYSLAIGVGTWIRIRHLTDLKTEAARQRAVGEMHQILPKSNGDPPVVQP